MKSTARSLFLLVPLFILFLVASGLAAEPGSTANPYNVSLSKDPFDYVLVGIQTITLIIILINLLYTSNIAQATRLATENSRNMLEEMKNARLQELEPFIVVSFDVEKNHENLPGALYFTVVNTGRTAATNVRIVFDPPLPKVENYSPPRNFGELKMFKDGIPTMPPAFQIRTTFGFYTSFVKYAESYRVSIDYSDMNGRAHSTSYILDLSVFSDFLYESPKKMPQLVDRVGKLNEILSKMQESLASLDTRITSGLWVDEFRTDIRISNADDWRLRVKWEVEEFKAQWLSDFGLDADRLNDDSFHAELRSLAKRTANSLAKLATCPISGISANSRECIKDLARELQNLKQPMFVIREQELRPIVEALETKANDILLAIRS